MGDYFLDSSALVKRHVKEVGTRWVLLITAPKAGHSLYIARITAVEIFAAVSRRQGLSGAQSGAILGHFRRHLTQNRYNILETPPALIEKAMILARKRRLRAYDPVQLAAATEIDRLNREADLGPVTFVSADRELNAAAIAEGLIVEDPASHS
ncbi:type II toxin-antitoxin system VapC family toxin [Paludisphaera rhizosphaerae]|uniref:type II toxin-antitoxin system VapC family toxin n=1 Tax=Paludisphaera rhizosphaerae TaxID=2711216 RepID=UPI0013ECB1FA|nr:type II toxin-antitoxin system VapC family toxin [Paludisphaera rhizosphaerae]